MARIVLDISGGNLHGNDIKKARELIDAAIEIDTHKHEVVFKAQLFESAPPNIPLDHAIFADLYVYCKNAGYQLTASVFDIESLHFLLRFNPVFVKIANRPDLYWLVGEVPRKIPVIKSMLPEYYWADLDENYWVTPMMCVSNYPAKISDYDLFYPDYNRYAQGEYVSDHTVGLDLWHKCQPSIWECHFCLKHDVNNPDAGLFAKTPDELKEIL